MTSHRRGAAVLAGLVGGLLVVGCAELPTSGPVERGEQVRAAADDPLIRVLPRPPVSGASPTEVVSGFLAASASFEDDHAVARLYLTPDASARWDPSVGVTIIDDIPGYDLERQARSVLMTARQVGSIGVDSALSPEADVPIERRFELERVDGQWRIRRAPQGLLLNRFDVDRAFGAFNTYFVNPDHSLVVPDPVYIPLEQAGSATTLLRALLDGPTRWLRPAVDNALPLGTSLVVDSVPVENGVAQVDLSTEFLEADAQDRELAAAQVTLTLLQIPEVTAVRLSVEGTALQLPGTPLLMDEGTWAGYDADALVPTLGALYVRGGAVRTYFDDGSGGRVDGPLGRGSPAVRNPSQSWDGSVVTALTSDELWVTTPLVSDAVVRRRAGTRLLPASIDAAGSVWAVDVGGRAPVAWRSVDVGPWQPVALPRNALLTAFRVSADATRVAVIAEGPRSRGQLLIGRIVAQRGAVRVEALRPVELSLSDVSAVTWAAADRLVVVGATPGSAPEPTTVFVNGSVEPLSGTSLAGVGQAAAAPNQPLLAATRDGDIAEYVETGWQPAVRGRDPAYPG